MLQSGLVSISFRALSSLQICELAQRAGLSGIEWGGDVHVPHGDLQAARSVTKQTRDAGLAVAAYGSYYRAGNGDDFAPVLASAVELGAPSIRVWAGEGSAKCDAARRAEIVTDLNAITLQAAQQNIVVATEYHGGTLTDTSESAVQLLDETTASQMQTLWQPQPLQDANSAGENIAALRAVLPRLLNVHVYHWTKQNDAIQRHALREGRAQWARYFRELHAHHGWALLEFVRDDEPENLIEDARTLNELLAKFAQ